MAEDRLDIRCPTPDCRGSLGAAIGGQYLPAPHLVAGREWFVGKDGLVRVRCRYCDRWYVVRCEPGHVRLTAA
jgi:hypothetical protein